MSGSGLGGSQRIFSDAMVDAAIEKTDEAGITHKLTPEEKGLNVRDALSFLDAVKTTFAGQPDVYNRFLDVMKDFKTQKIDTPGVIDRVSDLFKDHARLIQDFNTFLPFGYRIHLQGPSQKFPDGSLVVSTPNKRVEYKSGVATDLQKHSQPPGSADAPKTGQPEASSSQPPASRSASAAPPSESSRPPREQTSAATPQAAPTTSNQPAPEAASQQKSAGSARLITIPTVSGDVDESESRAETPAGQAHNLERGQDGALVALPQPTPAIRAMPEFNHAVDFVNRIKTRFQDGQTYARFLQILQMYQMERKTIHQVHAEVTQLFAGAHDLLDDFKTFLPERLDNQPSLLLGGAGAQQPSQNAPTSAAPPPPPPPGTTKPVAMPPYGPLPPSAPGKRKRESEPSRNAPVSTGMPARPVKRPSGHGDGRTSNGGDVQSEQVSEAEAGYSNMRSNGADTAGGAAQAHLPVPPQFGPLHPGRMNTTPEEHIFLDKVSRYIEDRSVYQEFLKMLNLHAQGIIDTPTTIARGLVFLVNAPELCTDFKNVMEWRDDTYYKNNKIVDGKLVIENVPARKQDGVRPDLENAETCGPSYRKLPESARIAPCSGRDVLCDEVLNDTWVCHSSAAYEEGFIPTPKNEWEQAMHQVEEERYEYDYHIEANLRTISLLEPIINRIQQMQPQEREAFCLKPGLGGQSKSIYQGTIKKIYGNENGQQVITALHDNPVVATPLVMSRLKQKDEEWKRSLREWSRVWREVDRKNYYKSLDPQGVNLRAADKKITPKLLVSEIEIVRREQQQVRLARARGALLPVPPAEQLSYHLRDDAVWFDVVRLIISYLDRTTALNDSEKARVENFIRPFLSAMFAIDREMLDAFLTPPERPSANDAASDAGSDNEAASQIEEATAPTPPSRRGPKKTKKEIADLRRKTLQRTAANRGRRGRGGGTHSTVSSREGTPDVEASENGTPEPSTSYGSPEPSQGDFMDVDVKEPVPATAGGLQGMEGVETVSTGRAGTPDDAPQVQSTTDTLEQSAQSLKAEAAPLSSAARGAAAKEAAEYHATTTANLKQLSWSRQYYNIFCGTSHYCFLRVFETIIYRLQKMKEASQTIALKDQGASLSVSEEVLLELQFKPKTAQSAYQLYTRLLVAVEQHWDSPTSTEAHLEDTIRKMFGVSGHWFYTIDKLMALLCKFALSSVADDDEGRLLELLQAERKQPSVSETQLWTFRKKCHLRVGSEENLFRICWEPRRSRLNFQLLGKDELQKQDEESAEDRWQEYIATYAALDRTPGVDESLLKLPYLKRTVDETLNLEDRSKMRAHNNMRFNFCVRTLHAFPQKRTEDWFVRRPRTIVRTSSKQSPKKRFDEWHEKRFGQLRKEDPEPQDAEPEEGKNESSAMDVDEPPRDVSKDQRGTPTPAGPTSEASQAPAAAASTSDNAQAPVAPASGPAPIVSTSQEAAHAPAPTPAPASQSESYNVSQQAVSSAPQETPSSSAPPAEEEIPGLTHLTPTASPVP